MEKNLTTGSVFKAILTFALPYLLSYFLQTLYGMADLYITGRFCGVDSITAVANGSQVMHMLTVIIVGLAMGSTVIIGHAVGAGNMRDAEAAIGNTVTLFMAVSLGFTAVLVAAVRPLVGLIGVPAEAVPGTVQYLTICFIGIPFITAYNIISSIFRGLGDSKSPMYFIAVACAANIALDILFIGPMALGPVGAALGTTLSQTLSVIVALFGIRRHKTGLRLSRQNFRPRKGVLGRILKIGLPVAVQDGCIQVAFIIITIIANHRGLIDSAAVGIVEKIISAMFIVPSSMLATVSALSSQNLGAGKPERAAQTLKYAAMIATGYGIAVVVVIELVAEPLHHRRRRGADGLPVHPRLYCGYHFCRDPLQLYRVFCRLRQVLHRLSPQHHCYCAGARSGVLPGFPAVCRNPAAYGAGRTGGFAVIRHDLRGGLPLDEAPRHPVYCRLTFPQRSIRPCTFFLFFSIPT